MWKSSSPCYGRKRFNPTSQIILLSDTNENLETLERKTFYIDPNLSQNGTIFQNYIHSDGFIINGATGSPAYVLSDGSTIAV